MKIIGRGMKIIGRGMKNIGRGMKISIQQNRRGVSELELSNLSTETRGE